MRWERKEKGKVTRTHVVSGLSRPNHGATRSHKHQASIAMNVVQWSLTIQLTAAAASNDRHLVAMQFNQSQGREGPACHYLANTQLNHTLKSFH